MTRDPMKLSARLRAGDPGLEDELSPVEVAELRRAIATAAETRQAEPWPWRAITAGAVLTVLAVVLGLGVPRRAPAPAGDAVAHPGNTSNVKDQQLQFETADGTRIVWVLSPSVPL